MLARIRRKKYNYVAEVVDLQARFIARRAYPSPVAYDTWVRAHVEEILGLPERCRQLPPPFERRRFESHELGEEAAPLRPLRDPYAPGARCGGDP